MQTAGRRDIFLGHVRAMKRKMCVGVGVQASRHEVAAVPMADPGLQGMSDEAITVEQFCRRYVEPMGEESDHVHIVALTDALQVCPKRNSFLLEIVCCSGVT